MARLVRLVLPGQLHLIVHRGRSGASVFEGAADADRYLDALRVAAADAGVAIHAYALLTNEVRMAVTPASDRGLTFLMQAVGRRYVRAFNLAHDRTGSPWEGRFRSTVVEAQGWLLECLWFVEVAGSAQHPDAARRSSLRHHAGDLLDPLITEHPGYWSLGNTPFERHAAYRRFVDRGASAARTASIEHAALHGWALGTARFVAEAATQTGRRVQPARAGRPRKTPAKFPTQR